MSPALLAAVTWLVAAAPVAGDDLRVAHAPERAGGLGTLPLGILPKPPAVVVIQAPRYGPITVDHAKHLAVRAPCAGCHTPMPVGSIDFTPQMAHRACIGCHRERAAGPTECAGCHSRALPAPGPEPVVAQPSEAAPHPPAPEAVASRPPGAAAETLGPGPLVVTVVGPPSFQTVELGLTGAGGFGPALRVTSRRGGLVVNYSFERVDAGGEARLLGLLGAGMSFPVLERVSLVGLLVGGFDALEAPAVDILPALGARAGVEWRPGGPRNDTVHLGLTAVADLGRAHAFGQEVGGAAVYATLAVGVWIPPKVRR